MDQKFESLAGEVIQHILRENPEWATQLGDHRYDTKLSDCRQETILKHEETTKVYLEKLESIDILFLSDVNKIDWDILCLQLKKKLFEICELREHLWNPLYYNVGNSIYYLLAREFAPLKERLQSVKERLKQVPFYYSVAKQNLTINPPKVHTETAITQNTGNLSLIIDEINLFLEQVPELKEEFKPVQEEAVNAIKNYITWLKEDLLPKSDGNFRLGVEKFRKKLHYVLESDIPMEELLRRAEEELGNTEKEIFNVAKIVYQEFFPDHSVETLERRVVVKAVLDKLAENCPTNETVVDIAKELTQKATDFVRENDFVTVPDKPVEVIVMPEFLRGVSGAYCDPPGPLEPNGKTFYAISPTPADWSIERANSFYREYNKYMLAELTIHEAMPGHYLQLAHANKFKAPTMVRAIFWSGTYVEGWAVYSERLMATLGFGGLHVKLQQLKMYLRVIINAIIDQKIHTASMTEEEAKSLMMDYGFQEEGEAHSKWIRACLTSTQLSTYFVGKLEVENICSTYQSKYTNTKIREMHDHVLSFGSPAPKYIKQALQLV